MVYSCGKVYHRPLVTCQWQGKMRTDLNVDLLNKICTGLEVEGHVVIDDAFPATFISEIQNQLVKLSQYEFKTAGIGRAAGYQTDTGIRGDEILWLDESQSENKNYFKWVEALRLALNQQFFLGLSLYECMLAHYPTGAFYHKHLDAFKSKTEHQTVAARKSNRVVSTLLYLNPNWQPEDGGELLMYHHDHKKPFKRILPQLGRLVVFLSEEFPHEVLPAKKSRYSLTGWFRRGA